MGLSCEKGESRSGPRGAHWVQFQPGDKRKSMYKLCPWLLAPILVQNVSFCFAAVRCERTQRSELIKKQITREVSWKNKMHSSKWAARADPELRSGRAQILEVGRGNLFSPKNVYLVGSFFISSISNQWAPIHVQPQPPPLPPTLVRCLRLEFHFSRNRLKMCERARCVKVRSVVVFFCTRGRQATRRQRARSLSVRATTSSWRASDLTSVWCVCMCVCVCPCLFECVCVCGNVSQ